MLSDNLMTNLETKWNIEVRLFQIVSHEYPTPHSQYKRCQRQSKPWWSEHPFVLNYDGMNQPWRVPPSKRTTWLGAARQSYAKPYHWSRYSLHLFFYAHFPLHREPIYKAASLSIFTHMTKLSPPNHGTIINSNTIIVNSPSPHQPSMHHSIISCT